ADDPRAAHALGVVLVDRRAELQLAAAARARGRPRLRRLARGLPPRRDGPLAALLGAGRAPRARLPRAARVAAAPRGDAGVVRAGVVGHVEWVDFAVVDRVPEHGAILHAREHFAGYVAGGDADATRAARAARVVVATPRALPALAEAHVELDALVASANDPGERVAEGTLDPPPKLVVRTRGGAGGEWTAEEGRTGTWGAAALPGEPVDSYGAGDTFAAALTLALGAGRPLDDALAYAARCGATCLCGRGPYGADVSAIGPP